MRKPEKENDAETIPGEGEGAGGGMYARPKGVYEITPSSTKFIPASNTKQLLTVAALAFLLGRMLKKRHKMK